MDRCEVCENFRPNDDTERPLVEVRFDVRSVLLCRGHALIAERSGVKSFEDLREYYGKGRRSYVPRRDPKATPTAGQRHGRGRRATD